MICAWPIQNVKSTRTTLIVAKIPKMPMDFQNAGASSSLHRGEQSVALVGEDDIEPDRDDRQQQQQRNGQDRPPAEPAPMPRDEVHTRQPPELSTPARTPDQKPSHQCEADDDERQTLGSTAGSSTTRLTS